MYWEPTGNNSVRCLRSILLQVSSLGFRQIEPSSVKKLDSDCEKSFLIINYT
jgi:hypothetical protein